MIPNNNKFKYNLITDKFLILFGNVGVGKSSFIKCFSKDDYLNFIGDRSSYKIAETIKNGFHFYFIEFPGIDANHFEYIIENIEFPRQFPLVNFFIIVLHFDDVRFNINILKILKLIIKFYPCKNFWSHIIIIRTFSITSKKFEKYKKRIEGKILEQIVANKELSEIMDLYKIDKPSFLREYFVDCDVEELDERTLNEFEAIFAQIKNSFPICNEKKEKIFIEIKEEEKENSSFIHFIKKKNILIIDFEGKNIESENLEEEIYKLEGTIINESLENKIDYIENKLKLKKDLDKLNLKNQILEQENAELKKQIEEKDLLKNNLEKESKEFLIEEIIQKDKEIKELKQKLSRFPFSLEEGEKFMSIIFISFDEKINYSIICKNTDLFSKIEKELYKEYPEYSKKENIFYLKGKIIAKNETLDYNNIKNNDIIVLK